METGFRSLLDGPSPAVVTVYRPEGEAVVAPVWFRLAGEWLEFVVAATDSKLNYLRSDPRCIVVIFEAAPPFRGVRVRGTVTIEPDHHSDARRAIASRYLGNELGERYADLSRRPAGFVVRLAIGAAKTWDLSASI